MGLGRKFFPSEQSFYRIIRYLLHSRRRRVWFVFAVMQYWHGWFVGVILLCQVAVDGQISFSGKRPLPELYYSLEDGQGQDNKLTATLLPVSSPFHFGDMQLGSTAVWSKTSRGFRLAPAPPSGTITKTESTGSMTNLINQLKITGQMSLELWLRVDDTGVHTIFEIGDSVLSSLCNNNGAGMRVSVSGSPLTLLWEIRADSRCRTYSYTGGLQSNQLHHVVLSLYKQGASTYATHWIDGLGYNSTLTAVPMAPQLMFLEGSAPFAIDTWTDKYRLRLAPAIDGQSFTGLLLFFGLSITHSPLLDKDIVDMYAARPLSRPVLLAWNATRTVQEDTAVDIAVSPLVYDFDIEQKWETYALSPNYPYALRLVLNASEWQGSLTIEDYASGQRVDVRPVQATGSTELTQFRAGSWGMPSPAGDLTLRYTPPLNAADLSVSFGLQVNAHPVTVADSRITLFSLFVAGVNDVPVPINAPAVDIALKERVLIRLTGQDVDKGPDGVLVSATLCSLPSNGQLFLLASPTIAVTTFPVTIALATAPVPSAGPGGGSGFYVWYESRALLASEAKVVADPLFLDSFTFSVADGRLDSWQVDPVGGTAIVNIRVQNPLAAVSDISRGKEDSSLLVELRGLSRNTPSTNASLPTVPKATPSASPFQFHLQSLPSNGALFAPMLSVSVSDMAIDRVNGSACAGAQGGAQLAVGPLASPFLCYWPLPNVESEEKRTADSFEFFVENPETNIRSVSGLQEVWLANVNDRLQLSWNSSAVHVDGEQVLIQVNADVKRSKKSAQFSVIIGDVDPDIVELRVKIEVLPFSADDVSSGSEGVVEVGARVSLAEEGRCPQWTDGQTVPFICSTGSGYSDRLLLMSGLRGDLNRAMNPLSVIASAAGSYVVKISIVDGEFMTTLKVPVLATSLSPAFSKDAATRSDESDRLFGLIWAVTIGTGAISVAILLWRNKQEAEQAKRRACSPDS